MGLIARIRSWLRGWLPGSMLFGGGGQSTKPTRVHHIRFQDSQYGVVIPIVHGRARVPAHIIWAGNLVATLHSSPGKGIFGGTGGGGFYTYSIAHIDAFAFGPITAFGREWRMGAGGLARYTFKQAARHWSFFLGALGQAPWSYLTSHRPGQDLGYSLTAYAAWANDPLGTSASISQRTREVFGFLPYSTQIKDADASAVIQDIISNPSYGMLPGATWLDPVTFAALTQYVVAYGFFVSCVFDTQKAGREWVALLLDLINAEALWSEGQMRVVAHAVTGATGNGVTFSPALTPVVPVFTEDDFILDGPNAHELVVTVKDPLLRNNVVKVEYVNVLNDYNIDTLEQMADDDITTLGVRRAAVRQYHPIPNGGMAAKIAQLKLQKEMQLVRTYTFKAMPTKLALVDPMDVIALTSSFFGLNNYLVRVVSMTESGDPENDNLGQSDLAIEVTCEDLLPGFAPGPGAPTGGPGGGTPCFFNPVVWIATGASFSAGSVGIWRNTDFVAGNFTNVDPPDWNPLHNSYQDSNMDADGKTVVAAGNLISVSLDGGQTFHQTNVNDSTFNTLIGESTQHSIAFSPTRMVCVGEYDLGSPSIGAGWWADRSNPYVWNRVQINTLVTTPFAHNGACFGLAYGNGAFVAGFTGGLQTSLDGGQTWSPTLLDSNVPAMLADETAHNSIADWNIVEFNGSYFLAVSDMSHGLVGPTTGNSCWMAISTDGVHWTPFVAQAGTVFFGGLSGSLNLLQWDAGHSVWVYMVGQGNPNYPTAAGIWTSPDGMTWTRRFTGVHLATSTPNADDRYSGLCPVCNDWFSFGVDFVTGQGVVLHATDPTGPWTRTPFASPPSGAFWQGWGKPGAGIMLLPGTFPTTVMAVSVDNGASFQLVNVPPALPASEFEAWAFSPVLPPGPVVPPPTQPPGGTPPPDPGVTPADINAPIFLEPHNVLNPAVPAHTLWIGVSGQGGDPNWGGAHIYMSDDGGASYPHLLGTAAQAAIMGTLLTTLPSHADPDTVDTLSIDLSESGGVVSSIAHAQADAGYNLAWVDGELIAFGDVAAGAAPNQFLLSYLRRGVNGTPITLHAAGANFLFLGSLTFLDPGVAVVVYPAVDVGKLLDFKFTSFNTAGGGELDISTVTAYPFTPAGP